MFAGFRNISAGHDGVGSVFSVEVSFSEKIDSGYIEVRDGPLEVDGGMVLSAHRVSQRKYTWALGVLPSSNGHVTIALPANRDCSRWGVICTDDGKNLSGRLEVTVPGPSPADPSVQEGPTTRVVPTEVTVPLTSEPWHVPESHNVVESFAFRILFSESVAVSRQALEEHSFEVSNGTVTGARAVGGREDLWEITVSPADEELVTITLPVTSDCSEDGAICTEDGRMLSSDMKLRVPAVPSMVEEITLQPGNNPATGPPTIIGKAQVGRTLRASLSALEDADGLSLATFRYEWFADGTKIPGARGSTYAPDTDDLGKTIRVKVSFTDDAGYKESLASEPTAPVQPRNS